jgi:hypothetical protein
VLTAWAMAAAIVLSASYAQQAFLAIVERWPSHADTILLAATVVPAGIALALAVAHIRTNRVRRYACLAAGLAVGVVYYVTMRPIVTEAFHFVEYGVLAALFVRAWRHVGDWSSIARPLLAAAIVGALDEWYQWFIPFRAGELRDVGINCVAALGGVIFTAGISPPRLGPLSAGSKTALVRWSAAAAIAVAVFFRVVHIGTDVLDPEIGAFRSRFSRAELIDAARDRAVRWRNDPPVSQRRVSREDQYLAEALWHVRRRNELWDAGDLPAAWRENRILERFYAPVLEVATYASPAGHRWTAAQRRDAETRLPSAQLPVVSDAYPYPLYVWSELAPW